jgi:hypothetical protein
MNGLSSPGSVRPCRAFGKLGGTFSQFNLPEVVVVERVQLRLYVVDAPMESCTLCVIFSIASG